MGSKNVLMPKDMTPKEKIEYYLFNNQVRGNDPRAAEKIKNAEPLVRLGRGETLDAREMSILAGKIGVTVTELENFYKARGKGRRRRTMKGRRKMRKTRRR